MNAGSYKYFAGSYPNLSRKTRYACFPRRARNRQLVHGVEPSKSRYETPRPSARRMAA